MKSRQTVRVEAKNGECGSEATTIWATLPVAKAPNIEPKGEGEGVKPRHAHGQVVPSDVALNFVALRSAVKNTQKPIDEVLSFGNGEQIATAYTGRGQADLPLMPSHVSVASPTESSKLTASLEAL